VEHPGSIEREENGGADDLLERQIGDPEAYGDGSSTLPSECPSLRVGFQNETDGYLRAISERGELSARWLMSWD
jgi:hypothetical protein